MYLMFIVSLKGRHPYGPYFLNEETDVETEDESSPYEDDDENDDEDDD